MREQPLHVRELDPDQWYDLQFYVIKSLLESLADVWGHSLHHPLAPRIVPQLLGSLLTKIWGKVEPMLSQIIAEGGYRSSPTYAAVLDSVDDLDLSLLLPHLQGMLVSGAAQNLMCLCCLTSEGCAL